MPARRAVSSPEGYSAIDGLKIDRLTVIEATDLIIQAAVQGRRLAVHLCNAYTFFCVRHHDAVRMALEAADLNLADGKPLASLARMREPVRGAALLREVVGKSADQQLTHYFYGGADGVAAKVALRIRMDYPGVSIVGVETPPYGQLLDSEVESLAERIRTSGAQIVWIGLGTPKQDVLVHALSTMTQVALIPVGAAFDFVAGTVAEAPGYLQNTGLEWMFRLAKEPRRLFVRYVRGNTYFILALVPKVLFGRSRLSRLFRDRSIA